MNVQQAKEFLNLPEEYDAGLIEGATVKAAIAGKKPKMIREAEEILIANLLIENNFQAQSLVYEHFSYEEDWKVIPLDDKRGHYWALLENEDGSGKVIWSPEELTLDVVEAGESFYSGDIYTQRFLKQWVFRANYFTMVSVDTRCDDNKFLSIFENALELNKESPTYPEIRKCYERKWKGI